MKGKPQFQPISAINMMLDLLRNGVEQDHQFLQTSFSKPWQLDDAIIERILSQYQESREFMELHKKQAELWRKDKLADSYIKMLDEYEQLIKKKNDYTEEIIRVTIDIKENYPSM